MLAICEPQVTGMGHEAINSAFIHGARLAFPDEKIVFFADQSHIDVVKKMFEINHIIVDNIEYRSISIRPLNYNTFTATFFSLLLFRNLFNELKLLGVKRLLLLSITSDGLYAIKMLNPVSLRISMVLHGIFEWIVEGPYDPYKTVFHRKLFNFKGAMQWKHSDLLNYIALSPHIMDEAAKYIDVKKYNIFPIFLPFIFPDEKSLPVACNAFMRFATIGKGNPNRVKVIASTLNSKHNLRRYEIKIIGSYVKGLEEGIENVNCVSPLQRLTRTQIEEHLKDVDAILLLYEYDAYKLSCSGAMFEAFAYCKPIIFLSNVCINYYNRLGQIGYECIDMDDLIKKMEYMINNYDDARLELEVIRKEMVALRSEIDIKNTSVVLADVIGPPRP